MVSRLFLLCSVLWACLFVAIPVRAQEVASPPEITLDALVQRALEHYPQLAIARQNETAAGERFKSLRAFPNPTLELTPRLAGNRETADTEVLLSQPLDVFGKRRAAARVKEAEWRGAMAKSTFARRSLIVQVKQAAIELYAAQEAESLSRAQLEIAQQFQHAAQRRAELGDVPQVQAQRAKLELLRTQNALANDQAARLAQLAAVNQLIGQQPATPLRVLLPDDNASQASGAASLPNDISQNHDDFLSKALNSRADLAAARAELTARQAQVKAIGKERLPEVQLQVRRGAFFGDDSSYALRAVVSMPVFDFGSIKHERRAAQAEARAQQAEVELLQQQIATQVEQALLRVNQQWQNVQRYRETIVPQTLDLLRKTQIGYDEGASSYLEVLEAQRTLQQVQEEYLQALTGTLTSETALENALGQAIESSLSTQQTEMQSP